MALTPRIELRQNQTLAMTPQLQQAIKLLQFSTIELREYIEAELAENPMLERGESHTLVENQMAEDHGADNIQRNHEYESSDGLTAIELTSQLDFSKNQVESLDMDGFDNIWERDSTTRTSTDDNFFSLQTESGPNHNFENYVPTIEQNLSQEVSLREYLLNQVQVEFQSPTERLIAIFLFDNLDNFGRITEDIGSLSKRLGCKAKQMMKVLDKLQKFDPPGIFARNLVECWEIQLQERKRLDPAMKALLQNIDLLKMHNYEKLVEICHVNYEDIQDMINEIWSLSRNPIDIFDYLPPQTITADIFMKQSSQGNWIVELNTAELPKVLVNNDYYLEITKNLRTKEEKKYINEKFQCANWLVKSLHQRATTILKVAGEIVRQQEEFFKFGVEHLRPIGLRNIAEEIEMHESTVSRVTSNKYIDTPRGIFELKYFFSSALRSSKGENDLSSEAVKHKINTLIQNEKVDRILSDDKLVKLLKMEGVDVARRTVAKYRESMKIPSSVWNIDFISGALKGMKRNYYTR